MLHGVHLGNGTAQYRNHIQTQGWKVEKEAGVLFDGLLSPPQLDNLIRPKHRQYSSGMALRASSGAWEGGKPHEIKVPGLETVGPTPIETS